MSDNPRGRIENENITEALIFYTASEKEEK